MFTMNQRLKKTGGSMYTTILEAGPKSDEQLIGFQNGAVDG